jgi:nicotinate-nucleotide adenylyltransferase
MSRIGVYGGSFNPVHNGHVKLAKSALDRLNLDKVLFVPTYRTPLRDVEMLPPPLRVKMLKAAVKGDRRLEVSAVEVQRKGLSFTVDTLKYLKAKSAPGTVLYFLSGADHPSELRRWRSWSEISKLCRFVVMSRPGHPVKRLPDGVLYLPFDAIDVSSTQIRERLKARKSVRDLMPDASLAALMEYSRKEADKKTKMAPSKKVQKKGDARSKPTGRSK